jgi:hypothetical protein
MRVHPLLTWFTPCWAALVRVKAAESQRPKGAPMQANPIYYFSAEVPPRRPPPARTAGAALAGGLEPAAAGSAAAAAAGSAAAAAAVSVSSGPGSAGASSSSSPARARSKVLPHNFHRWRCQERMVAGDSHEETACTLHLDNAFIVIL